MMHKLQRRVIYGIVLALAFLLAGCSQDIDLTLWEGNRFSAAIETSALIGDGSAEEMSAELDTQVTEIRRQPNITRAEWERIATNDDEFRAQVTVEGDDYGAIETILAGGATVEPVVVDGREAVEFTYTVSPTSAYTLTLRGGEVLSTNGTRVENHAVRWNGGEMRAVVTPRARGDTQGWTWLAVGAVVAALLVFFVSRGRGGSRVG